MTVIETAPAVRVATPDDALRIINLYHEIYEGTYPDARMTDFAKLRRVLASDDYVWIVADDGRAIVGSIVYRVDPVNLLAKVFGGAVLPAYRGHKLTEKLMVYGTDRLKRLHRPVEVVYATTRTVLEAPQKLTSNLGYRKLGIFPNVHKTAEYETHALTALFSATA
ncbi:MAG: GNAT family N-acetyltransferase, partial [Deltaproteobacteria bacterium]|nr:GNAT family N-acetyltransferase [Deltaproteobacteria bacterium]